MEIRDVFSAAVEVQEFMEARGWSFCIIGGLAAFHWGEPRVTRDVDITVITGFGKEETFIESILTRFTPRIADAVEFALQKRVLLLKSSDGTGIDISMGALPFEESAVARSRKVEFEKGHSLRLCSAEDSIVFKTFAARSQDWRDVEGIIARQGATQLDWKYIEDHFSRC